MKRSPVRGMLFVAGLLLFGWGIAPGQSAPVAAAPLLLVTETPTSEPASPTNSPANTPTTTPANPPPPTTATPISTPTAPPATDTPAPTFTPAPDQPTDDEKTATPTPTAAPTLTPTAVLPAVPGPDPALSKSVSPPTAVVGDTVTYTILVTNLGGTLATGVVVEDTLPSFLAPGEATISRGQVSVSGQLVRAEIGDLAPGETVELRVTARVIASAAAPNNRNLATVSSTSPDVNPDNNQASGPVDAAGPVSLPNTGAAERSPLPLLVAALGRALILGSTLVRRRR